MQASDGLTSGSLLDPAFFNNYQTGYPFRWAHVQCKGSYVSLNVAVPTGARSFTLPQRTLSMGTVATPNPPNVTGSPSGELTYTASVDTAPDIVVTVSPTSSALGGTTTTTVTVKSINGFSGTVALSLVGQSTGQLPALPSGGLASGGYTIVGEPAGMVEPSGPTAAQLAAHVQGTFSPASVTLASGGTATATLTLTSSSAGAAGTYPIEIEGDGTYTSGSNTVTVVRDGLTTLTLQ